ncbi:SRPBCC domain-containing protein [Paenibacillus sp. alder61]|uniref:ATPase n=1 Tax=Paenibacillus faecis TaxID=862114 RepID=A0A5D0CP28_9BACL|nr:MULTISPECIES: SRPBCC domain-containing protein [Paenibacillus]MCA1296470.1 SRPBCC domain-containing protein [Paenibacillus sp. alder61]TYA11686.1 ATPase [Paenibacillus faecis]
MRRRKTVVIKDKKRRRLIIERFLPVKRELVWLGWTRPEHIVHWWGPGNFAARVYEMDVRPGGVWRYSLSPVDGNGDTAYCLATYSEISEPIRLAYIDSFTDREWNVVKGSEMPTLVTFEEETGGTRLTITTQFSKAEELEKAEAMGMIEGYQETINRLEDHFSGK